MRIKLFAASNMAEAMRKARCELGEDALILGSRRVSGGVEITAALEPDTGQARLPAPAAEPAPRAPYSLQRRLSALRYGPMDWARPIMLVGTPGAGKTLVAAKLATRLVQSGARPMVITADADRAGAAEQLAAFTRILGLDLTIAENPLMLARALAARIAGQKAIIDMAGFNPFDALQREYLTTYAVTADAGLIWILPAGMDCEDTVEMAGIFGSLGVRHMIPTKLDIARRFESVYRAAEAGGFILTDAGTGPGIAEGLIPLEPQVFLGLHHEPVTGQYS